MTRHRSLTMRGVASAFGGGGGASPGTKRAGAAPLQAWTLRLIAAGALATAPTAIEAEVVTLEWVENRALEAPSALKREQAQQAAKEAETRAAASRYQPQVGAELSAAVAPGGALVEVLDPNGQQYLVPGTLTLGQADALLPLPRYGASLGVEYALLSFGRKGLDEQLGRAQRSALEQGQRALAQARVAAARAAYLAWLGSYVAKQVSQHASALAKATHERVAGLVEEGVLSSLDALEAQRSTRQAALQLQRAHLASESARRRLATLVGEALDPEASPEASLLGSELVAPANATPPTPLEAQSRVTQLSAERAARESRPWLGLSATAGVRGQQDRLFPVYRAAISAQVPLWDGGGRRAREAALRAQAADLTAQARAKRQRRKARATDLRALQTGLDDEIAVAQQVVALSEQVLGQKRQSLELGAADFEDLSAAQSQLVSAELELLQSQLERLRVRLECRALRGCRAQH